MKTNWPGDQKRTKGDGQFIVKKKITLAEEQYLSSNQYWVFIHEYLVTCIQKESELLLQVGSDNMGHFSSPISAMRIRRRPPPQISSAPNASKLEKRSIAAGSAQLHRHGDLLKGLHGWRRKPNPSPLDSHHQVVPEEEEMKELDSHEEWKPIICSGEKSSGANGPYGDIGDEETKLKAKGTARNFNVDYRNGVDGGTGKKQRRPTMEGSRCSRVNGRGWRCGQETMVGYALCQHHLGKGRLRSLRNMQGSKCQPETIKGRRKIGMLKAHSMSSLISNIKM